MSARITLATAARVLRQIRRDPRTVALVLVVPSALLVLLYYLFDGQEGTFQRIGAPLCGLLPFIVMFLLTSIAMLRERTTGTLERLMTLPLAKLDLLLGYAIAFGLVATVQAVLVSTIGFTWLDLDAGHSTVLVIALAVGNGLLGMAMGLLISAFASTEFQVVQFMPAFVLPQILLCGLFQPRDEMAPALEAASDVLPLTYAFDALLRAASPDALGSRFAADVAVLVGAAVLALVLGAATLRRRTP
jgi:ABC-2 type transport system permease protein